MCGIAGFCRFSGCLSLPSAELLGAMTASLAHRGPDDAGTWRCAEDGIGLGNQRLAIIERGPAGAQPMANEAGTLRLTFNGEIYNHQLLRAELASRGHRFRSRSDTEAILHAYEEWDLDCFTHFNGMWALALWDGARKRLVLSRDRLGIKPLYYLVRAGQIRFASEIKALFVDGGLSAEVDLGALALAMTHLVAPAPRTLFRGVCKLPPGHVLLVERDREPRLWAFWDPLEAEQHWAEQTAGLSPEGLEAFAVEAVREQLRRSVGRRMMSEVPLGLFLSGGLDSSTIAALMREHTSGPLATFSVAYAEPRYVDERPHSRRVARLFGCDHHEVVLGEGDLIDAVDDVVFQLDEPNADWVSFAIYALARQARRSGSVVILSGEGSDEIFGGYAGYLRATRLASVFDGAARSSAAARRLARIGLPILDLIGAATGRGSGLRDDLERLTLGEPPFIGLQIGLTERLKRFVLASAGAERGATAVVPHLARARTRPALIAWRAGPARDGRYEALRWISYLEVKHRLAEMLLVRLDKMTMAHGVEGRVPFLDHELVELALALPGALRVRGGVPKYLLKRAAEQWLPADLVHRPKVAFGAPVASWLRGRLGRRVEAQLMESGLVRDGTFRGLVIRDLIAAHRAGKADHGQAIWVLYNAGRWYDAVLTRSQPQPAPLRST